MFIQEIRINLDDHEHIQRPIQIEELKPPEVSFRMLEHTYPIRARNGPAEDFLACFSPRFPFAAENSQCKRCLLNRRLQAKW